MCCGRASGTRPPTRAAIIPASLPLKMKVGMDALAEFRARLPDVQHATESPCERFRQRPKKGRRKPTEKVIVLGS